MRLRLQIWARGFEWSKATCLRVVRWTLANALAAAIIAGLFWQAERWQPEASILVLALAFLAFGGILGAGQWLALRGWSTLSRWWLLLAPPAGLGRLAVRAVFRRCPGRLFHRYSARLELPCSRRGCVARADGPHRHCLDGQPGHVVSGRSSMGAHAVGKTGVSLVAACELPRRSRERLSVALRSVHAGSEFRPALDTVVARVCRGPGLRSY